MTIKLKVKPKRANDTSESTKNVGIAKVLTGKICVQSFFVAPRMSPWNPMDIQRQRAKLGEAELWLMTQASRYGKYLEFSDWSYGLDGSFVDDAVLMTDYQNTQHSNIYPYTLLSRVGFPNLDSYMQWDKTNTGCSQCIILIFSNTPGRCFTSQAHNVSSGYNPLECCFLFRFYPWSLTEIYSTVIAHEILHLFGAWDLYELNNADHNRATISAEMFPQSIMFDGNRDIWTTQIDEINAWLVGLKEEGKDWYRWFEPGQSSYESYWFLKTNMFFRQAGASAM